MYKLFEPDLQSAIVYPVTINEVREVIGNPDVTDYFIEALIKITIAQLEIVSGKVFTLSPKRVVMETLPEENLSVKLPITPCRSVRYFKVVTRCDGLPQEISTSCDYKLDTRNGEEFLSVVEPPRHSLIRYDIEYVSYMDTCTAEDKRHIFKSARRIFYFLNTNSRENDGTTS